MGFKMSIKENLELLSKIEDVVEAELKKGFIDTDMLNKKSSVAPKVSLNPEHGARIAHAYETMKHEPNHPQVKNAYNSLIKETKKQYKDLLGKGYKFSRIGDKQENPYKNSKEMHSDLEANKHLWHFPTDSGFGSESSVPKDHPMLQPTEFKDSEGKPMLANDIFRIVHDINGHHMGGKSGFGPTGEHQAYLTHKKMYSQPAQRALATETMGQNSWVTAGPHAEYNKKNPKDTIYAEQKAGLLPDHIINNKWHGEE
jgi:hypothetical protein